MNRRRQDHGRRSADGDGGDDGPLGGILAAIVFSPIIVPNYFVERDNPDGGWTFVGAPYSDGAAGYFLPYEPPEPPDDATPPEDAKPPDTRRKIVFQIGLEGLAAVDGTYGRLQARARALTIYRVELDVAYALYLERTVGGGVESAWLGQAHLSYRFAQNEHVQFRAGLGVRHWLDAAGGAVGPDLLYGIDIFWGRPFTTSLEASAGLVGKAAAGELRGTFGVMLGPMEPYVGYEGLWIQGVDGSSAFLGGPVAGIRGYF